MASRSQTAVEPCLFPRFEDGLAEINRTQFVKIDLDRQLQKDCLDGDKESLRSLLCVCWALVLHCYTGLDNVYFGYQDLDHDTTNLANAEMQIASVETRASKTISDLSKDIHFRRHLESLADATVTGLLPESSQESLFNTAIICRYGTASNRGSKKAISSATSRSRSAKGVSLNTFIPR